MADTSKTAKIIKRWYHLPSCPLRCWGLRHWFFDR